MAPQTGARADKARQAQHQTCLLKRFDAPQAYAPIFQAMQDHVARLHAQAEPAAHEIWQLEHEPVFTQGRAGKAEHVLAPGDIPVVQTDRGGQVTYHGPGQLMTYCLFDLKRLGIGVSTLVHGVEAAIVSALGASCIAAHPRADAPGVYVESGAKIASLGLRVTHALSYHGVALNVDMNLEPFQRINPCGYQNLPMTDIAKELGRDRDAEAPDLWRVADSVAAALGAEFGLIIEPS